MQDNRGLRLKRAQKSVTSLHPGNELLCSHIGESGLNDAELFRQNELTKPAETTEVVLSAEPIELRPPLPLTYAWQLAAPTAKRFHAAA